MNSDSEAIAFFVSAVFKYDKNARIEFKKSVWPYLKYFLTKVERAIFATVDRRYIQSTKSYKRIFYRFL